MKTQSEKLLRGLENFINTRYPKMSATSTQSHMAGMLAETIEALADLDSPNREAALANIKYWKSLST